MVAEAFFAAFQKQRHLPKFGKVAKFNLRHRTYYPCVFFGISCVIVVLFLCNTQHLTVTISLLAAVGGFSGFLYTQHSRDTQFFHELFREFNARYDDLNGRLNDIRNRPKDQRQPLNDTDKNVLCDYFNLCAEEWIYDEAGYIDPKVWRAWHNGMHYFAENAEIGKFWEDELKQDSYYGFPVALIAGQSRSRQEEKGGGQG
jgi:hypothetical protein